MGLATAPFLGSHFWILQLGYIVGSSIRVILLLVLSGVIRYYGWTKTALIPIGEQIPALTGSWQVRTNCWFVSM